MKGTRHSEEQIIAILKQGEAGLTTAELCRQHGITEQTYCRWKVKYGGMDSGDAKKLKQLEDERTGS
jgi:putative transposase